jgi:hypothetical protein
VVSVLSALRITVALERKETETTLVVLAVVAVPQQFSLSTQLFRWLLVVVAVVVARATVKLAALAQQVTLQTEQQQTVATEPARVAVAVAVLSVAMAVQARGTTEVARMFLAQLKEVSVVLAPPAQQSSEP